MIASMSVVLAWFATSVHASSPPAPGTVWDWGADQAGVRDRVELALRPSVNFRPQELPVSEPLGWPYEFRSIGDQHEIALKNSNVPPLRMKLSARDATFTPCVTVWSDNRDGNSLAPGNTVKRFEMQSLKPVKSMGSGKSARGLIRRPVSNRDGFRHRFRQYIPAKR